MGKEEDNSSFHPKKGSTTGTWGGHEMTFPVFAIIHNCVRFDMIGYGDKQDVWNDDDEGSGECSAEYVQAFNDKSVATLNSVALLAWLLYVVLMICSKKFQWWPIDHWYKGVRCLLMEAREEVFDRALETREKPSLCLFTIRDELDPAQTSQSSSKADLGEPKVSLLHEAMTDILQTMSETVRKYLRGM